MCVSNSKAGLYSITGQTFECVVLCNLPVQLPPYAMEKMLLKGMRVVFSL